MQRRDHLSLVPLPRCPALRHNHILGSDTPMMQFNMALPPIRIVQAEQRLEQHTFYDAEGFLWWWWGTRRCECGFMAYTEPEGGPWSRRIERGNERAREATVATAHPAGIGPSDAQTP